MSLKSKKHFSKDIVKKEGHKRNNIYNTHIWQKSFT